MSASRVLALVIGAVLAAMSGAMAGDQLRFELNELKPDFYAPRIVLSR